MTPLEKIAHFADVPVDIVAELDRRFLKIETILELQVGSVISLTRSAGENIDIIIGGAGQAGRSSAGTCAASCAEMAAAACAAGATASVTSARPAWSAQRPDSTATRSDSSAHAAVRHGVKFPIW